MGVDLMKGADEVVDPVAESSPRQQSSEDVSRSNRKRKNRKGRGRTAPATAAPLAGETTAMHNVVVADGTMNENERRDDDGNCCSFDSFKQTASEPPAEEGSSSSFIQRESFFPSTSPLPTNAARLPMRQKQQQEKPSSFLRPFPLNHHPTLSGCPPLSLPSSQQHHHQQQQRSQCGHREQSRVLGRSSSSSSGNFSLTSSSPPPSLSAASLSSSSHCHRHRHRHFRSGIDYLTTTPSPHPLPMPPPPQTPSLDLLSEAQTFLSMSMLVYIYSQLREMSILGYTECDFREIDCNSKYPWKRPRLTTEKEKDGDVDEEGLDDDDPSPAATAATSTTTSDPHLLREEDASFRSLYRSGSVSFRTADGTEWGGGSDNNNYNTEYLLNTKKADFIIAAVLKELESEENNEKFKSTFDRYDTSIVKEFHKWVEDSRSNQLDDAAAAAIDATRKRALLASSRRSAAKRRAEAKLKVGKSKKKKEEEGEGSTTTTTTNQDAAREERGKGERAAGAGAPQACDGGSRGGGGGGADVAVFNDDDDDDRARAQRRILPSSSGMDMGTGTGTGMGMGMGMVRRKSLMDLTRIGGNNSANPAYDDDSVVPFLFPRDGSRSGGAERQLEESRDIATSSEAADGYDDDEEHRRRSDDSNADVVSSTTPSSSSSSASSLLPDNSDNHKQNHHHRFKPGSVLRSICESDVEVAWFGDRHPNEAIYSVCVSRRTRTVTVVFRGSVNAHNWSHNVKCMISEETNPLSLDDGEYNNYEGRSDSVRLHTGFSLYLLKQRRDDGRRKLDEIYDKIRSIGRELRSPPPPPDDGGDGRGQEGGQGGGGYRLCVAGHSLGGALATLFSFFAASAKDGEFTTLAPVRVFTFAAPRVGDASFANAYRHLERKGRVLHARFVNRGDVVPLMPTHTFTACARPQPTPTAPILPCPPTPPRTPLAESADAGAAGGGEGSFGFDLGSGLGLGGSGLLSAAGMYKHVGLQVKLHETNWLGAYRMGKALDVSYAKGDDWWTNVRMMWKNSFVSNFSSCTLRGLREVHILSTHNRRLHFARQFCLGLGLAEYYSSGRQRNLKTLEEYYSIKAHHGGGGPPSQRGGGGGGGGGGRFVAHIARVSAKRKKRLLGVAAVVLVLINCLHESGSPVCRAAGDRPAGRGKDDDESSSSSLSAIIISAQRQKQKGEMLSSSSAGGGRRRGPNSSDEAEYHLAPAAGGTESRSGKDPLARGVGRHPHDEIKSHAPLTRGWGMMNGTGAPPSFIGREAAECAMHHTCYGPFPPYDALLAACSAKAALGVAITSWDAQHFIKTHGRSGLVAEAEAETFTALTSMILRAHRT